RSISADDGDKTNSSPGRARNKPLKPLRAGMPGESGGPSVTTLVCYLHIAREAAGALATRHSPRPLLGERYLANLGRSRRGNAESYLNCFGSLKIESEATSTSSRTSERSERDPGSITTNGYVARTWGRSSAYNMHRWLWVPAFRGDDKRLNCFGCLKIESVQLIEYERAPHSQPSSPATGPAHIAAR